MKNPKGFQNLWGLFERVTGIEPVTFCLGSKRSTAELHPLGAEVILPRLVGGVNVLSGRGCLPQPHAAGLVPAACTQRYTYARPRLLRSSNPMTCRQYAIFCAR